MLALTALILTYNERENLGRTLDALRWVPRILILDSFSSDETCTIAARYANVEVRQRQFDSFAGQCNYGLAAIGTPWVISLDADYICSPELANEIQDLKDDGKVAGYSVSFRYLVYGYALRTTIYPDRVVLYQTRLATYRNEGHGHRVAVSGPLQVLEGKIDHDDRKPLGRWLVSQDKYARVEAEFLRKRESGEREAGSKEVSGQAAGVIGPNRKLSAQDRLRLRVFYAPWIMFLYLLFVRGLILDGWRGWFYVAQRVIAELLLSLRLLTETHALEREAVDEPKR